MKAAALAIAVLLAAGCAARPGAPVNRPAAVPPEPARAGDVLRPGQETLIGLAFSGGGTRAAAFSHGVLAELAGTPLPGGAPGETMLDQVRYVSGVSGGSVTAAWFGLHGAAGLPGFPEAFLLRDAEAALDLGDGPLSVMQGLGGGVNGAEVFRGWLDAELFHGARISDMDRPGAPRIWINATDIFNRTPFIFEPELFAALCSDVAEVPVADAVAASAAVPVVFAPTVLEAHPGACDWQPAPWMRRAVSDPGVPAAIRALAGAVMSYRDPTRLRYVKLFDGGISDNIGVTALMLSRLRGGTPHAPLSAEDAVRVRRILYLVVNAGKDPEADWTMTPDGPAGFELILAPVYAAIDASVRHGFDAFRLLLREWTESLIRYRCALPDGTVRAVRGGLAGWDCRDIKIFVGEVRFERLDPQMRAALQEVPTSLNLPPGQVALTVEAGREALRRTPEYRGTLRSIAGAFAPR